MRDKPAGVTEAMLAAALRDGWGIETMSAHRCAPRRYGSAVSVSQRVVP